MCYMGVPEPQGGGEILGVEPNELVEPESKITNAFSRGQHGSKVFL